MTVGRLVRADALRALRRIPPNSVDLVLTSPPYNIGKQYERDVQRSFAEYKDWQASVAAEVVRVIKRSGSICWQVGSHVRNGVAYPLDLMFYEIFSELKCILRNRIIWQFNFGLNADRRFSGRYETVLWFTKSDDYIFNLDPVRVRQLYPGKRHSKRKTGKAGSPSGNILGKNPSDYWEFSASSAFLKDPVWKIPNVKANHPEKTSHPCQFPVELAERCVLAFTNENDIVLDPFAGVGTTVIAAIGRNRCGLGIERDKEYVRLARSRVNLLNASELVLRPSGREVALPNGNDRVSRIPEEWGGTEND